MASWRRCGGFLEEMWWLIGGNACGGFLEEMWWFLGGEVVAS